MLPGRRPVASSEAYETKMSVIASSTVSGMRLASMVRGRSALGAVKVGPAAGFGRTRAIYVDRERVRSTLKLASSSAAWKVN